MNKDTGDIVWRSGCNGGHNKCDSCWTTPTLVNDKLVLGCGLDSKEHGVLWGLNEADGKVAWSKEMANDIQTSSPVMQSDGTFILGSISGHVYCIEAATGDIKWEWKAEAGVWATPAIGADGTIYVGSHDEHLYALGYGAKDEV